MNTTVFRYWNGQEDVWADPITLLRRLHAFCGGDANAVVEQTWGDNPVEVTLARDKLLAAIRAAFDMPFDQSTGMMLGNEDECFAAYDALTDWLDKKKVTGA
jgi:hypothetical protein